MSKSQTKAKSPLRYRLLWIFCALAMVYILAPIVIVVVNSFNSVAYNTFPPQGFSLRWYQNVFEQKAFFAAFGRSIGVALLTALVSVVFGVTASLALTKYHFPGSNALRSFFMAPLVLPKIVIGVGLFIFFAKVGLYGSTLSLVLAHTVVSMPFVVTIVISNLMGLDKTLEEASMDLGASRISTFFRITLPQIAPGLLVGGIFSFITSFDQVETSLFLVRPQNNTLPIEMFLYMEKWQDPTIAALSSLLILCSVCLVLVLKSLLSKMDISKLLGD